MTNPAPYPPEFEFLWEQFPRKVEKHAAWLEFKKQKLADNFLAVTAAVWIACQEMWLRSIRRAREAGEPDPMIFVPHPRKWLHRRGWLDYADADLAAGIAEAREAFDEYLNPKPKTEAAPVDEEAAVRRARSWFTGGKR